MLGHQDAQALVLVQAFQLQEDAQAERKLGEHSWARQFRELENVIHHALPICQQGVLGADDLHLSSMQI
nr:hypothetical protein [uncultured Albidiferax sp.]